MAEDPRRCESPLCGNALPLLENGWRRTERRFCSDQCKQEASLIRRVAKLVRFPANAVMEGHMLRGTATLEFARSAFGYGPYSALLGAIRNKDAVALHVDLVAIPE